ncbi:MAG: GTPase Era [Alphaproteobacteria bacterium]|nr:GTPase Era [Alphaproteobacteria bacterium]
MSGTAPTRAGFAAILGAPNAGKSTLVNALVGSKIAIVTHKVQTTRAQLRAVAIAGPAQVVIVDTPGIFAPRRRLDEAMVAAAWSGAEDADARVLLVDAHDYPAEGPPRSKGAEDTDRILEGLAERGLGAILVLNKIDLLPRARLLALAARLNERIAFDRTLMISALSGDGVDDLRACLAEAMPEGPWLYPEDQLADVTERLLAAEITRERLILRLHDELPYASTVITDRFAELADGSVRIEQAILVERDSQRPIVIGKGGQTIKEIGSSARAELEQVLERRVHLFLDVRVKPKWSEDPEHFREIGLEKPATPHKGAPRRRGSGKGRR